MTHLTTRLDRDMFLAKTSQSQVSKGWTTTYPRSCTVDGTRVHKHRAVTIKALFIYLESINVPPTICNTTHPDVYKQRVDMTIYTNTPKYFQRKEKEFNYS